jgi:MFS family permease
MHKERSKRYLWILVPALWLVYLINMGFPMYGGSVANTYMTDSLHMSRSTLGAGFSLFSLFQGLCGVVVLLFINRSGVRFTLLVGALLILAGALLMSFAVTASWHYVIVYGIVLGLGVGFGTVLPITTSVTHWFGGKRALAMALVLTAGGIGGLVAAPVIDWVVTSSARGWKEGWELIALAAALAAATTLLFVRERPPNPKPQQRAAANGLVRAASGPPAAAAKRVYRTETDWEVAEAFKSPELWLFAAGSVAFTAPFMLCVAHSVLHLRDMGVPPSTASMSLGLLTILSIGGRLVAGFLGDRIEPRFIWSVALVLLGLGCLALIRANTLTAIAIYASLVGVGFGAAYVCRPIAIGNYFGTSPFASINGILSSVLTLFSSATPLVGGLVHDRQGSYSLAFVGVAVLAGLGSLCLLLIRRPQESRLPARA